MELLNRSLVPDYSRCSFYYNPSISICRTSACRTTLITKCPSLFLAALALPVNRKGRNNSIQTSARRTVSSGCRGTHTDLSLGRPKAQACGRTQRSCLNVSGASRFGDGHLTVSGHWRSPCSSLAHLCNSSPARRICHRACVGSVRCSVLLV